MHQYKRMEFRKLLFNNGFSYVRSSGGHDIYVRGTEEVSVPLAISPVISQRLIKQYKLKNRG